MKLTLRQQITQFAHVLQTGLFPVLNEELGGLTAPAKRLVATLEMIPLARFVPSSRGWIGRPSKDRLAIASAFVAKAVYGFGLTRQLLDALASDSQLRRICGWKEPWQVPSEATFSRAFGEFARMELPQFVHETLIRETQKDRLIGHIARDSTTIEARERYPETPPQAAAAKPAPQARGRAGRKKGSGGAHARYPGGKRPNKPKPDTRLERQRSMTLPEMLADLPKDCDLGGKKDSHGNNHYTRGYKLHWDVADGQIPISVVLTSASLHDSQVAIPLATMSTQRVNYCYELMDAAYEAQHIDEQSRQLGHIPIVDPKAPGGPKSQLTALAKPARQLSPAQRERYKERTMVERANARLKDEFGGRNVRVRGAAKVMAHLMFGVLALTADQLMKLVS
ncbi:MAG: transposase [Betaproteobacteria bacterium]